MVRGTFWSTGQVVMSAVAGIDIALWDLKGKATGRPVYALLGGALRSRVPAYVTGFYYREGERPDDLAREAAMYLEQGYRTLKVKVGGLTPEADAERVGRIRKAVGNDVAIMLAYARRVVVVPGYGLAVAQAQHDVRALADLLEERGIDVTYAIHPVAGRMPGHMNVLLAEANVPYPQLKEMEEANPEFPRTDVALVIGANDVTNPAARSEPGSPIYGMPILDVDRATSVVVLKRGMSPGFAGIDNPLFYMDNAALLFGDAKASVTDVLGELKSL